MSRPLVTNAANENQLKSAAHKENLIEEFRAKDFRKLLEQKEFRRFAWRYLCDCHVFKQTFDHSGSVTSFNEGKRSVGLKLMAEIVDSSPEAYLQMMKENQQGDY
jgi:hypothetical protein